jgi:uncharacterized Zn-binding protein involved in type VI secretion
VGTPACRITDETEHGGVIVMGFPTVLIGMLPAARIGDNHVCPMVTPGVPPIPHVGGPFVMGSPTVLVGDMPQSRVTDQLVCVGPPDMAVMGEPTVLVGMVGAGGLAGAMDGLQSMGIPVPMSSSSVASAPTATLLSDGTMLTSAPPGSPSGCALPPISLNQPGWPDLPPESTTAFQSVQPVTLLAGTTLYAPAQEDAGGGNLWSVQAPEAGADAAADNVVVEGNDGVRAWMGQLAAPTAGASQVTSPHVWTAPGTAASGALTARASTGTDL